MILSLSFELVFCIDLIRFDFGFAVDTTNRSSCRIGPVQAYRLELTRIRIHAGEHNHIITEQNWITARLRDPPGPASNAQAHQSR